MTDKPTRKVEHLPLSDLIPNPSNPKDHDLDVIDSSVGRFGFVEPIVVDGRTGKIISGHGRTQALSAMEARGETPPEGITVDSEGKWLIPTVTGWSSRTDTEASAALIALNRATELGGWVDESLLDLLDDLGDEDHAFLGVGYTEEDREALRTYLDREEGVHETRDLDDLAEEFGEPTEEDSLVRVVLRLPKDVAADLAAEVGADPAEHLAFARRVLTTD